MFDMNDEQRAEWTRKYNESVAEKLDEEVLATGAFRRTGAGTRMVMGKAHVGAIPYAIASLIGKRKAGGLPSSFLLAVTPNKVHAFGYKPTGRGFKVKDEVGVWDRTALRVTTEDMRTATRLTIESPAEEEKVVCDTEGIAKGQNPWADAVIRLLKDPSIQSA